MKTWAQVSESPEFLALPASEQENAREQYFIDVVAPRAPRAELAAVRKQFDADTRIRKQDLPAGMAPSSVQGGRGMSPGMDPASMSVLDSAKLNSASAPRQQPMPQPAAEPAGLSPEWGGVDQPVAPRGSILEQPTRTDVPFIESSRYARQVDDAKQRARQQPGTMRAASRDQSLAFDVNEALPDSAVARGAAAGFASLGRVGIGAARIAADFTGADDAGRMLRGASGAASATEQGAMTGLAGNDKLVADVTSSIMNSAPSLAVGVLGGPALRALFAQSTLAEYNAGRDAGFDPGESLARAGIMGAAEAVGERFGLSEQIRLLKATTKGMPQNELAKVLGSMIAKEIPGEQLTTAMQVLADKIGPAALQPNATFADYLEAAGETLKVTIGQTAVMGGGPAAVSTARNVYRNADRAAQAPESAAAAAIEDASSAYATFFKPAPEAVAPTAARADTLKRFDELAAAFGLNPKAAAAVRQQAGDMLPDEAPGFLARVAQAMNRRGLFRRPVDDASVADLDKRLRAKPDESAPSKSGPTESFTMTGPDGVLYRSEFGPDNKVNWVPAEPTPREPENTNDQPDVPGTAAEPVRPADGGGDLTAGGELAVGPGADAPGDVVRAAAGTGERDRAPDAVADGGGPDAALTIPPSKFTPEQALARMERQAAEDGQRRADTPDFEDREATDILSPKGTAWASKGPAQKRLKELGDGYRLARVSTGWVVKSSGSRLSTETDTTGYKQPEQDAAAPASTPAAGVEPAAAPVAAAPPAPAPDAVAAPTSDMPAAKQQMREVTQRIEALNDEFRAMYRDNIAYFTGDGPSRKLTKGAPQELRDRWDAYKAAKKQAQADYDAASARMSAATPAPAPKAEAPAAAPVAQPAAPAPKPRQPNGSDSKKAEALFKPPQAADTFADGQRVTLNGTSYTVAKATKTAVTPQGEDGKKRLVQVSAPAYGKIKAEVDNQVDKAEAPATQPEVDAVPAAEPVAEAPPARKDRRTMQEKVEAPAKDGEVVASVGDPNAKGERKFYVTMVRGDRVARLAGPFDTKEEAEAMKPRAQEEANKADPRSAFDAFGVSAVTSKEHKPGRLNEQLGIAPSSSPAPEKTTPAAEGGSSPLYASRPLTKASADAIRSWAASQGFKTTLPAEDLHVTVAYSREPMDGSAMKPAADTLTVTGGKRTVGPLGDEGAVVLKFTSPDMQARWKAYRDAGASWDYESYTPHVTITYDGKGVDLSKVEPYAGPIELGPERQEPLNVDKADDYKEAGEVPAAAQAAEQGGEAPASSVAPMPGIPGISMSLAQGAHRGTSFSPERRGEQEVSSYRAALRGAWERAARIAGTDEAAVARITEVFEDVASGYHARYSASLGAKSQIVSTMIAGGSNFPARRMEKRNATARKRAEEADQYLERGIKRLIRAARGPIDNSPESELERVRLNLTQREEQQELMKAANAALRKDDDAALEDLGFTAEQIADLKKGSKWDRGFPAYKLTNNNAEIRRLRERLKSAEERMQDAAAGPVETERAGVKIVEDATDDRLRLLFDGKPSEAVREDLKANGFKWSPKNEAWQRQLTDNARRAANEVLDKHYPTGPATLQNISPTADTPSATLQALSEVDDLFALPRLSGTTVSEIAFDLDPTIKVMPLPKDMGRERWRVTLPNGQFGDISIRKATAGRVFGFDLVDGEQVNVVTERPGDNPEDVEESTEDVWIDVSRMATGSGGNQVYAIAGALAHNTGRIFIGDPNGLSKVALRRRSEQMLSLALRYGTTRHLAPHPDQIRGDKDEGVPPLKWVYGDDEGNVQRLVALNVKAVENAFPDLAKIDFDAATGDFLNAISGARIDRSRLAGRAVERRKEEAGGGPLGRAAAAGRTVARAVVLKALSRPQGSGAEGRGQGRGQGRDGLLDRLGAAASGPARTGLTGLFDLSRIGARIAQMGYQPERAPTVQATKRVRSISERLESGKISEPEAAMAIRVLAGEMDRAASTKAANRLMAEKVRGADEARIKLLQARKRGDLDPEAVDFALWAIDQNPALVDTMGLSVKTPPRPGASGDYNPANEVVRLFKGSDNPYTAVHEILHHTERMMPADMQAAIRREWAAALAKAMKAATPEQREALQNIAGSLAGDKPAHEALVKAIQEGPLNYDQHYHLVNPSEFWAVNASRLLGYRFKAKDSVWQRIATWLQEMAQKLKGLLGLRSDAPVLKAIDALLESDGSRQSASMLANKDAVVAAGGVLESQEDGIIRVRPMMLPSGPGWVVAKRDPNVGEMHLGYYRTEPEAREAAERERTEVRKGYGGRQSNRWWTPTPRTTIQSTGDGRLDSVGRDAAVRETLAARANSIKSAEQAEGLEQIPDRVGWCFPCAAQASAAGLGDMVIGRATGISGDVWHAVVMRDGAVYDPTFGLWFEPGVYEESLGFAPHTTLAPAAVRDFIAKTGGMAPDARNLKLDPSNPSVAENLERKPNDGKEDRKAAAKALTAGSIRNLRLPAGYVLSDFLGKSQGRLSVWRKTVGTPYDLAQRNTQFKRVFDEIQDFLHDVSHYAAESADRAPRLLPKLDGIRDIVKGPVKAEDAKAIAAPIFEGTLSWARDETGAPVRIEELEARAEAMSAEDKAGDLLRRRLIDPRVLRMWQGLPLEQYEAAIDTRYRNEALRAGVVWSDAELRSMFNLTGERGADGKASGQIGLYDEFRAATDKSLDDLTISAMLRVAGDDVAGIREQVLEGADLNEAAETIRDRLLELAQEIPAEADLYRDRANAIVDMADRAEDLKARGYAPLSRFGTLTLDVVTPDGERQYFGLFETSRERNRMARRMRENFPDANIEMDTLSQEAFKQFAGVTPETLELFGDKIGMFGQDAKNPRADALFQEWLAKAKSNRSGLKRLIYRKGVPGFSEDVGRVLASFVYSNARQTSLNLHAGEAERSIEDIDSGELKDYAIRLNEYVKNPQEEAQALRGLLFVQFLGGSVASAMVNMTQPFMVTLPYLAQYGGAMKASARMAAASKDVGRRVFPKDPGLAKALREAEEDGIVSPQEVFHLQAQAAGKASLMSGDGTALGWTGAAVNNSISRLAFAWGRPFAWAEQFNRRLTFIAAYRTAVAEGINDPAKFAANAVDATQFVYNKGSRPEWARGAVGATLFTFKTYAVNMVELLVRSLGTKEGRRAAAVMLFMMALMAGIDGLPFMEDIEDVIDGFSQRVLDQNFSTKTWRNNLISDAFLKAAGMAGLSADSADAAARFVQKGLTGLPGAPIDVSGRLGMHNLIPGTGLLLKKAAYDRDVSDIGGPAASFAARAFQAGGQVLSGDVAKAALTVAPIAVQNVAKAAEMGKTGYYPDSKERMVVKTTLGDAVSKGVGFQPQRVKNVQDVTFEQQRRVALTRLVESEIADALAKAVVREDEKAKQAALERLQDWNRKNPETPIKITNAQITARAKAMSTEKTVRVLKAAPKELRQSLADAFSREPATQE